MTLKIAILELDGMVVAEGDELAPGAEHALEVLDDRGFMIIYLVERPEDMRGETERWIAKEAIAGSVVLKNPQVSIDSAVQQLLQDIGHTTKEVLQVLFIHPDEEVRWAVAELHDPRITIKYSLHDAILTDGRRNLEVSDSPLLGFLEELTAIACCRETFESDGAFALEVQHPPDEHGERGLALYIQAFGKAGQNRLITVRELWPHQDPRQEGEVLRFLLEDSGRVLEVYFSPRIQGGDTRPGFNELPQEKRQRARDGYAAWRAGQLRVNGYLEAARYQRNSKLFGEEKARAVYQAARHAALATWLKQHREEREHATAI